MSGLHQDITGTDLHEAFHYVQSSDPGAVGAGKYWLDTTSAPFQLRRRNGTDTGWDDIGGAGGAAAFTDLTDVPASYTGQANAQVLVNPGETGLAFLPFSLGKGALDVDQSIPDNTDTPITFDIASINRGATYIDLGGDPTKLIMPETAFYLLVAQVNWASGGAGIRAISIRRNGSSTPIAYDRVDVGGTAVIRQGITTIVPLSATDELQLYVFQTSGGGALNVAAGGSTNYETPFLAAHLLGLQ